MELRLLIHLEAADDGPVWWAESDDLPGFNAAAPSLKELRALIDSAIPELVDGPADVTLHLVGDDEQTSAPSGVNVAAPEPDSTRGIDVTRVVVRA